MGPIEVSREVADAGVPELRLLAEDARLVVEGHLAEQEGGTPDVVLEHQHVSQVQLDSAFDVERETRHVNGPVEEGLGGGCVV